MNWTPICVLPNIELDEPVESNLLALVSFSDPRVQGIKEENFRKFLKCFTNPFGEEIHPTLILQNIEFEKRKISSEFIAYFRDIIVASTVPYSISKLINGKPYQRVAYSSYFSICPWMISDDYECLIGSTPAFTGVHNVDYYKGQSSPELWPVKLSAIDFDWPILCELLRRWTHLYKNVRDPDWKSLALFRSLNMANQALLLPTNAEAGSTIFDYGRSVVLWVSAFEILIHPGGNDKANKHKVFELFEKVPWINKKSGHKLFQTKETKNKKEITTQRNLACWIYDQMHTCRNNFVHGNPVNDSDLNLRKTRKQVEEPDQYLRSSRHRMYNFAPILYRLGLTTFLDLTLRKQYPETDDTGITDRQIAAKMKFENPQIEAENALQLAAR